MPKFATDPPVSERQRKAMWAAREGHSTLGIPASVGRKFVGPGHDATVQAAGIIFLAPSGKVLWLKRSSKGDHEGTWCFPGGKIEPGETPEDAAVREAGEECSYVPEGKRVLFDRSVSDTGVDYTDFLQRVEGEFQVVLDDEHDAWAWAPFDDPPQPVHPAIADLIERVGNLKLRTAQDALALDRASVRSFDADGHLHVASSVVSAAQVNDYLGEEIPGWEELGLDPQMMYPLLRDPEEIEKGAQTLHGKPLMIIHRAQTANDHDRLVVVGSVMNPVWNDPNLKAEFIVWDGEGIDLIESEKQADLSAGYRYKPIMESGTFNSVPYAGRMTNIFFNHLALVPEGRVVGAVVGDSAIFTKEWEIIENALISI